MELVTTNNQTWQKAIIALGSNLDNPQQQLKQALLYIDQLKNIQIIKTSSFYQSKAQGYIEQADFINAVIEVTTNLKPLDLLEQLLEIEEKFFRIRSFKNAPRTLDLDLLCYGDNYDFQIISERLTLPHPRLHLRTFVLLPLLEIIPNISLPNLGLLNKYLNTLMLNINTANDICRLD